MRAALNCPKRRVQGAKVRASTAEEIQQIFRKYQ